MYKQNYKSPESFLFMMEEMCNVLDLEVLEEESRTKGPGGGLKFKATFQTAEEENNNNRVYRKRPLEEGIQKIDAKIKRGQFFGELDHPKTDSPARFTSVLLKDASHRVLALEWDNNTLKGVGQTLSTRVGKDMRALIEEDGIKVGFSLRALGKTEQRPKFTDVVGPLNIIAFDCVGNPSHSSAMFESAITESSIKELMMENSDRLNFLAEQEGVSLELLAENDEISYNKETNKVQFCTSNKCVQFFLEEYILEAYKNTLRAI